MLLLLLSNTRSAFAQCAWSLGLPARRRRALRAPRAPRGRWPNGGSNRRRPAAPPAALRAPLPAFAFAAVEDTLRGLRGLRGIRGIRVRGARGLGRDDGEHLT